MNNNITTIYFIRHAQSDFSVSDDRTRPLTEKGLDDRKLVTDFLWDKDVDTLISSPYKRAIDTIADFSEKKGLSIELIEDFREKKSDYNLITANMDVTVFWQKQWADFNYKFGDGECLAEVQKRNIAAFKDVLKQYRNKTLAVGTHGMALSMIINYYDNTFGYDDFMMMVYINPWVAKMMFDYDKCVGIEKIDLFKLDGKQ